MIAGRAYKKSTAAIILDSKSGTLRFVLLYLPSKNNSLQSISYQSLNQARPLLIQNKKYLCLHFDYFFESKKPFCCSSSKSH